MLKTINQLALPAPLTPNQVRGFWAAWGGLVLDGMDSFIYALVLVPAMRDLLPRSGIEPTIGNLGFYGSILFSVFLVGWAVPSCGDPLPIATDVCALLYLPSSATQHLRGWAALRKTSGSSASFAFLQVSAWVESLNAGYYVGIFLAAAFSITTRCL